MVVQSLREAAHLGVAPREELPQWVEAFVPPSLGYVDGVVSVEADPPQELCRLPCAVTSLASAVALLAASLLQSITAEVDGDEPATDVAAERSQSLHDPVSRFGDPLFQFEAAKHGQASGGIQVAVALLPSPPID